MHTCKIGCCEDDFVIVIETKNSDGSKIESKVIDIDNEVVIRERA